MVGEDRDKLGSILFLEKRLDGALGELGESIVRRSKTVKGPGPFKASTRPAALTAATNVLN